MARVLSLLGLALAVTAMATAANAATVGERHLETTNPTAALRDAQHRDTVRVTVWYPAAADAKEERIDLGPPGKPMFIVGQVAQSAAFVDARPRPVILFSHGFGGTARMMAWFGAPLARSCPGPGPATSRSRSPPPRPIRPSARTWT